MINRRTSKIYKYEFRGSNRLQKQYNLILERSKNKDINQCVRGSLTK